MELYLVEGRRGIYDKAADILGIYPTRESAEEALAVYKEEARTSNERGMPMREYPDYFINVRELNEKIYTDIY